MPSRPVSAVVTVTVRLVPLPPAAGAPEMPHAFEAVHSALVGATSKLPDIAPAPSRDPGT